MDPGLASAPPHVALGMRQEFRVSAPGMTPGPVPSPGHAPAESDTPGESHAPEARVIELEMNAALEILQDGVHVSRIPVTPGETITFRVTDSAGYAHHFRIGPDDALASGRVDGLPGIPEFDQGTQELTWTVPQDAASLSFGCTVPGHSTIMNGSFVAQG